MRVLKFGGTSVGSAEMITNVISILQTYAKKDRVICVVSAIGGITDKLIAAGHLAKDKNENYIHNYKAIKDQHLSIIKALIPESNDTITREIKALLTELKNLLDGIYLINELSPKTSDKLTSFGELMSSLIVAEALKFNKIKATRKNSQDLIITNNKFTKADVNYMISHKAINDYFNDSKESITVLPGFISKSEYGEPTTLGRGGSDFTASIVASALKVNQLEIWTDVSGMFTSNPKLVKQAIPIKSLSYQEAMELSHFGAKVLYAPTVQPALDAKIPIVIKNTLDPEAEGTLISDDIALVNSSPVKGLSHISDIALLTLQGSGMVGIPGISKRLFETLANEKINVILITQASSEHSICFGIESADAKRAKNAIHKTFEFEISQHKIDRLIVETDLSIIALVGDNMKNHQGISGRMFSSLGKNNINIRAIAQGASERNISAVIDSNDIKKALNCLHERFFEDHIKRMNVFITGVGNVGERLIDQIRKQETYLHDNLKMTIKIVGLSNSKKMVFNEDGLDLEQWPFKLRDDGENSSLKGFLKKAVELNLRNSVFIDITASDAVANMYGDYLKHNIAVIACNKIACSSDFDLYQNLKRLSLKYNAPFLYETNVGAGLPVIDTLNNLVASGDKITSIQAVLSGSLNFIFNNFNERKNFHDTVKQAQFEGYTEPDPRIDLSGIDVARKTLILARESGIPMEVDDVTNDSFLTENNLKAKSVDDFYKTLKADEPHFQKIFQAAKQKGCRLKYVAEYKKGKSRIGLKEIAKDHPFYNLEGKDNIVMFYTQRYPKQPMIIKGAGAGADVTASGLFADIIRIGNN
ncbi:bifunctional aspartate kinase/homoserine dehydrogenase I [Ichthyenterobacterium sp. W332]|uniref:Bifunctional aspartate kinase/homoserine dehydrogenase I n=1 Tax=Microcosmobacter mediterraneus TaxID=3075607 RepID=A0ABU2YP66_9FLAO|nr:bifunctional aspartate kinase/homoserine dehydrogenase I [Ichthyenterobacterium sp. W332]MDT0559484.1 bifunctional aspartate kinase/homoserine dehydrogenase I [Ichthyenterobacterium sp. W332]